MKIRLNNKYVRWGLAAFVVIAASITFYYFIFHGHEIRSGFSTVINLLMPVIFGLTTAYLLTPILNFVEEKVLHPLASKLHFNKAKKYAKTVRGVGILITAFLFIALIYLLIYMLMSQIVPSVQEIVNNFDSYTNNFIAWVNKTLEDNPAYGEYFTKTIDQYSEKLTAWIEQIVPNTLAFIKTISLSVINLLSFLWDFIIGFIISIYVLANKELFAAQAKKLTYALFERETANIVIRNFRFTHKTFIGFMGGKIVDSIIIGILCFIGTSLLKMPYAALVSVIVGCTNIIPFFGPFLGAIPCTILIFVVDPLHPLNCLYFVIFIFILQQFDGNFLGPKILGNATGLSGFWVIFAITFFGGMFGILGMIAGVPVFSVIYAAIRSFVNSRLKKKEMSPNIEEYSELEYIDESGVHHKTPDVFDKASSPEKEKTDAPKI